MLSGCSKDEIRIIIIISFSQLEPHRAYRKVISFERNKRKGIDNYTELIRLIMRIFQIQSICSEELPQERSR